MTITVTPTVDTTNVPARVRLDVSASAGETSTTVTRLNADGTTVPVRTSDGNPLPLSSGTGLLYDYEMTYGSLVSFSSIESPSTVSAQVAVPATRVWLIHPGVPSLSQPVSLQPGSFTKRVRPVARGVHQVMGRANLVVQTDGVRHGSQSQLVILVKASNDRAAIEALTGDASPLLLNVPTSLNYNISSKYISVGDIEYAPVIDKVFELSMAVTMPFDEVDRPAGGSQSQRTYADVLAQNATYQTILTKYSSYTALLAGP